MKGPTHDRLQHQLEAEIHLYWRKTVKGTCRRINNLKQPMQALLGYSQYSLKKSQKFGHIRKVLLKENHEGLSISITDSKEHGAPVLISEIHPCNLLTDVEACMLRMPSWQSMELT